MSRTATIRRESDVTRSPGADRDDLQGSVTAPGDAFTAELERLRPGLASWLARRGVPSGRVGDLVQDAIVKAWHARATLEAGSAIGPWLIRIVERIRLDDLRSRERRARHESEAARTDVSSNEDPHASAAANEASARIASAIAQLPARQRDIVRRFYTESESVARIAEATGIPSGTIKSDLHRARAALATWLRDEETLNENRGGPRD